MTEMKRFIYAVLAVAATLSFAACSQENEQNIPGAVGDNTISFTLKTGTETRSAVLSAAPQTGVLIPLENEAGEHSFYLEETIASLDDEAFFAPAETRGTPAYTQNFPNLSGGKFQALPYSLWNGAPRAQAPAASSKAAATGRSQARRHCNASSTRDR